MATGRIGVTPTLRTRWSREPAGGTTSLSGLDDNSVSLVYDVGYEQVYRNGVLLSRGNDYTATDGTTITLIDATIAGDIIEVFANQSIPLSDAISRGQFTAKGSLLSATAASTPAVLAVGANNTVLTADSSTATGLKWATVSAGGMTEIASGSLTGSSLVLSSIPGTYRHLHLSLRGVSANANANMLMTFNSIGSGYLFTGTRGTTTASAFGSFNDTQINLQGGGASNMGSAYTDNSYFIEIFDYATTNTKKGRITEFWNSSADAEWFADRGFVAGDLSAAITTITITLSSGSYDAGNYVLWGLS